MKVIRDQLERDVPENKLAEYLAAGWTQPGKNKATKPAETAPEAATEDLGNDISKGE